MDFKEGDIIKAENGMELIVTQVAEDNLCEGCYFRNKDCPILSDCLMSKQDVVFKVKVSQEVKDILGDICND